MQTLVGLVLSYLCCFSACFFLQLVNAKRRQLHHGATMQDCVGKCWFCFWEVRLRLPPATEKLSFLCQLPLQTVAKQKWVCIRIREDVFLAVALNGIFCTGWLSFFVHCIYITSAEESPNVFLSLQVIKDLRLLPNRKMSSPLWMRTSAGAQTFP